MTAYNLPDTFFTLPPEERVTAAGLALLKHYRKMPTQDQVVQALARPEGEKGTAKGTVNKYWSSLQNEIARELSLAEWLPAELPEFVIDHLKQLMDWARKDAEAQLAERQASLSERERQLDEAAQERAQTEATLLARITELEAQLEIRDEDIKQQVETQATLEQALARAERTAAVQEAQLAHAEQRDALFVDQIKEFKEQVRTTKASLDKKDQVLKTKDKDMALMANRHQSLQHRHEEQLRKVSSLESRVKDLQEQLTTSERSAQNVKSQLDSKQQSLLAAAHQLAKQEGQLATLEALQSSVTTLNGALTRAQERCQALEKETQRLGRQLEQARRKPKKKPS